MKNAVEVLKSNIKMTLVICKAMKMLQSNSVRS